MAVPTEADTTALTTLAARANEEHRRSTEAATKALLHARNAGEALNRAKDRTPHGSWVDWVRDNFEGSARTARLYMRIASNWSRLENRQPVANLTLRGADRLLRASEDDGEDSPESWPVQPGHGAIVNTPELIAECRAWILPSDHEDYFWLTIITGESASAQNRPVHGSAVREVLRHMGFPLDYADWVHLGAPAPSDYNRLLFESREHQLREEKSRWHRDEAFASTLEEDDE